MENYGIQILKARYFSLKEKHMVANEEMLAYPNQHSAETMSETKKMMDQIKDSLLVLGVNILKP